MPTPKITVFNLESLEYKKAYCFQLHLHNRVKNKDLPHAIMLLEHPPVITMGVRSKSENLYVDSMTLNHHNIDLIQSNRGGDITYHGPGQLVVYPIMNLEQLDYGVKSYVRQLEETVIQSLASYHILSNRKEGYPGVWVESQKIAAIGCKISQNVSMHGFALNVNTNLDHFSFINPCGLTGMGVTSMEKLLKEKQSMQQVRTVVLQTFLDVFNLQSVQGTHQMISHILKEAAHEEA